MSIESGTQTSLMTIRAAGAWQFGFRSAVRLENLEATEDQGEPAHPASADVEMAVASLPAATCAIVPAVAHEMGFGHSGVSFEGEAKFSVESSAGQVGALRRFERITGTVTVVTDEPQERLDLLAEEVGRRCRPLQVLDQAGIATSIDWRRTKPKP